MSSIRRIWAVCVLIALVTGVSFAVLGVAHAVKPPTEKERAYQSKDKYDWNDLKPGKKATTKSGKFCECGVSATNENECYHPREGQLCCNPKTGDCRMLDTKKINTPW